MKAIVWERLEISSRKLERRKDPSTLNLP